MQLRPIRWLAGALVLTVIAGTAYLWRGQSDAAPAPPASAPPLAAAHAAPRLPVPPPAIGRFPSSIVIDMPLREQVDALLATNNPHTAYTAYLLVSACTIFNARHQLTVYDERLHAERPISAEERTRLVTMCGGMTERERQARLDHLAAAVKGGVPGAAWSYAAEGPFGDPSALQTRPDDPLVREWKATAVAQLERAAAAGDLTTLIVWGFQKLGGTGLADKDPQLGYGYLLAFGMIRAERFGAGDQGAQTYREGSAIMQAMSAGLSEEQRRAALAIAHDIAAKAKAGL